MRRLVELSLAVATFGRPFPIFSPLFFDVLLITDAVTVLFALRRFGAETPPAFAPFALSRLASPRIASHRNARKIETWWRFTRTKTDRLLREFNRLMTACRRWHLVIGGCALLLRVPSPFSLSLRLPALPVACPASHACNCPVFPCLFANNLENE